MLPESEELGLVYDRSAALKISILGPLQLADGFGSPVLLRGHKAKAILGMLALVAPQPVPRRTLADLLWSSKHKEQADASLRQCVVEVQKALRSIGSEALSSGIGRLMLSGGGLWVDVAELECVTAARPEVLQLLRGPLLEDLDGLDPAFDRWLAEERHRIAKKARVFAEAAMGDTASLVDRRAATQQLLRLEQTGESRQQGHVVLQIEQDALTCSSKAHEQHRGDFFNSEQNIPFFDVQALSRPFPHELGALRPSRSSTRPGASVRLRSYATRLGIMPLRGLDRASDEIVAGLTEEITTALGQFRGISCTLLAHAAVNVSDHRGWQASDLAFVLDGSVQCGGGRVRVIVRALDLHDAAEVVWSQKFDLELTDILMLRDEIASQIVAQLDPALMLRQSYHAAAHRPTDATAYHLLLRAIKLLHSLEREEFLRAGDLLAAAAERDPSYAPVHAWSAYWHILLLGQGWAKDSETSSSHLQELTQRAVSLDPSDARALTLAGHVRAFTGRLDEAMDLHERALSINPNLPLAWLFSGLAHTYSGQHSEAIRRIERAKKLSPLDPHEFFFEMALTLSHLLKGEFERAVSVGRKALELNPRFSSTSKCFLSALGYVTRPEDSAQVLAHLLALEPDFTIRSALERSPLSVSSDRIRYAEGLRRAGLPE